jgi:hypothetical protein
MNIRIKLLATAATTAFLVTGAHAAPAKKHHRARPAPAANAALLAEVKALRQEISDLRTKVDTQSAAQAATASQVTNTQAAIQATQTQVQAVQTQVAAAPSVTTDQVNTQIASAITKEHNNDKFYFKGLTITPGGYLEALPRPPIRLSRTATIPVSANFTPRSTGTRAIMVGICSPVKTGRC